MRSVVLHWPTFGPYHLARLRACQKSAPEGVIVHGLAIAGKVAGRPWVLGVEAAGLSLSTLFPELNYERVCRGEVGAAMARRLDVLRPDVMGICGYGMADGRAALRWCLRQGVGRVLMTESKADDAPRVWWRERIKRWLVSRFDSALCGGRPHREYLNLLGMPDDRIFDKYDVVGNEELCAGAERARRDSARYRHLPGLDDGRPFFLASSRFIARKNLVRLVDAYRGYRDRRPGGWRLILLGAGPDEAALQCHVRLTQTPDVVFAGFQQFGELVAYYGLAGVFIHPALSEQWGLVVNEAMACGLPVLVSRQVGASRDLVEDGGNGYTFDPVNVADLSLKMGRLADDPSLRVRMGLRSAEIIREWTPEHFGRQFWRAARLAWIRRSV